MLRSGMLVVYLSLIECLVVSLVKGAGILIVGEPDIVKYILLLQLSASLVQHDVGCLYISGEESGEQITKLEQSA